MKKKKFTTRTRNMDKKQKRTTNEATTLQLRKDLCLLFETLQNCLSVRRKKHICFAYFFFLFFFSVYFKKNVILIFSFFFFSVFFFPFFFFIFSFFFFFLFLWCD